MAACRDVHDRLDYVKVWDEDLMDHATMQYDGEDVRDLAIKGSLPVKPPKSRQIGGYDYYTDETGIPVSEPTLDIKAVCGAVKEKTGRGKGYERLTPLTGHPGSDYYGPVPLDAPGTPGITYWDTVAGEERLMKPKMPGIEYRGSFGEAVKAPLPEFDADAIIEEVRQFIAWLDEHEKGVEQRLVLYRKQRRAPHEVSTEA